jgi:hypothetical protein
MTLQPTLARRSRTFNTSSHDPALHPWEVFSGIHCMAFDAADKLDVLDPRNHPVVVFCAAAASSVSSHARHGPAQRQAPLHITMALNGAPMLRRPPTVRPSGCAGRGIGDIRDTANVVA